MRAMNKLDSEANVVHGCLAYLKLRGIYAWRQNTGAAKTKSGRFVKFGMPGTPDIVGMLPGGRFLGIECKRPNGGRQSPAQKLFQANTDANNGVYLLVTSVGELSDAMEDLL